MSWGTLNSQIYNLINNNKSTLNIQEIADYPKLKFNGYPAVSISPSDNTNDYETTSENQRDYVWRVRIFYETKNTGMDEAINRLMSVVDSTIDLLDQENELDTGQTIGINLPTRYTFINIFAVPGVWGTTTEENLIFTELTIRIRVSVDVT